MHQIKYFSIQFDGVAFYKPETKAWRYEPTKVPSLKKNEKKIIIGINTSTATIHRRSR